MGEYWKLANFTRKQFIHPHKVGNGLKWGEWAEYESDVLRRARELLACEAWLESDEIAAVSDYDGRRNALDLIADPESDITKVWAELIDGNGQYKALHDWTDVSVGQVPMSQQDQPPQAMRTATPPSLRDHFAGLAMQGMLATYSDDSGWDDSRWPVAELIAEKAYQFADAMLAAREGK